MCLLQRRGAGLEAEGGEAVALGAEGGEGGEGGEGVGEGLEAVAGEPQPRQARALAEGRGQAVQPAPPPAGA